MEDPTIPWRVRTDKGTSHEIDQHCNGNGPYNGDVADACYRPGPFPHGKSFVSEAACLEDLETYYKSVQAKYFQHGMFAPTTFKEGKVRVDYHNGNLMQDQMSLVRPITVKATFLNSYTNSDTEAVGSYAHIFKPYCRPWAEEQFGETNPAWESIKFPEQVLKNPFSAAHAQVTDYITENPNARDRDKWEKRVCYGYEMPKGTSIPEWTTGTFLGDENTYRHDLPDDVNPQTENTIYKATNINNQFIFDDVNGEGRDNSKNHVGKCYECPAGKFQFDRFFHEWEFEDLKQDYTSGYEKYKHLYNTYKKFQFRRGHHGHIQQMWEEYPYQGFGPWIHPDGTHDKYLNHVDDAEDAEQFDYFDLSNRCEECPPGYYQNEPGKTSCKKCADGNYLQEESWLYTSDSGGNFKLYGATTCRKCSAADGRWQDLVSIPYHDSYGSLLRNRTHDLTASYMPCRGCPAGKTYQDELPPLYNIVGDDRPNANVYYGDNEYLTEAECKDMADNGHLYTAYNEVSEETNNACYNLAAGTVIPWYGVIPSVYKGNFPRYCILIDHGGTCKVAYNAAVHADYNFAVTTESYPDRCLLSNSCSKCGVKDSCLLCCHMDGDYCCKSCYTYKYSEIKQNCDKVSTTQYFNNYEQRDCSVAYKSPQDAHTGQGTDDPRYYTPEGRCVRSIPDLPKISHCV